MFVSYFRVFPNDQTEAVKSALTKTIHFSQQVLLFQFGHLISELKIKN